MRRDIAHSPPKTYGKLQTESPLSPYRAFVVQFRAGTDITRGQLSGRVEHVVSGQATHFASLQELLAFIERVLTTVRAQGRKTSRAVQRTVERMPVSAEGERTIVKRGLFSPAGHVVPSMRTRQQDVSQEGRHPSNVEQETLRTPGVQLRKDGEGYEK
jgi:hypothetical protein